MTFDDVAELYDEVRPRYPEQIVEQIISFAGLSEHARLLEVGCGTGQMTLPFARRGYEIVALDKGERLAALAAQHCRPHPRVQVVSSAFEAWRQVPASFDLVLSAQAFHWIAPSFGLSRADELLKGGGALALVWTLDRSQETAFWKATGPIYDKYYPQSSSGNLALDARVDVYRRALGTSTEFVGMHEIRNAWTRRYSGDDYLKLMHTYSDHHTLPAQFFEEIARVIAKMGDEVIREYETLALLAKRDQRAPMRASR